MLNFVEIWLDYRNLKYFIIVKKLNHRQAKWLLYLARFDFVLYYYLSKFISKLDIQSQRLEYDNSLYNNKDVVLLKLEYLAVCALERLVLKGEEYSFLMDIHPLEK